MNKCVVVPDSFKGSLSAVEQCEIARETIGMVFPSCEVLTFPVADGGEGTVDCFLHAMDGERVAVQVSGPRREKVDAFYGRFGDMAVVEMAAAAGLPMVAGCLDPAGTTTFGVGELLRHAVEHGARRLVLGMGGSCTNDGGCGCAAALGVKFFDKGGGEFLPVGNTLGEIAAVDRSEAEALLRGVEFIAICDIANPLHGKNGAAYVYAPQKGADADMVELLDGNLRAFGDVLARLPEGVDYASLPGAGAAGGLGAGVASLLGAQLKPGIDTVLDLVDFDAKLDGADLVFTGEGRLDGQSLQGKVVIGVARRAKEKQVPVFALVGSVAEDARGAYDLGVSAIFTTNRKAAPLKEATKRSRQNYAAAMEDILRAVRCLERR